MNTIHPLEVMHFILFCYFQSTVGSSPMPPASSYTFSPTCTASVSAAACMHYVETGAHSSTLKPTNPQVQTFQPNTIHGALSCTQILGRVHIHDAYSVMQLTSRNSGIQTKSTNPGFKLLTEILRKRQKTSNMLALPGGFGS